MSFGMVAAGLGAASAVKSLAGGSGGGGGGTTASKDPWGPVAPWLENNVKKGEQLQGAYEQNPFNQLQQTAYQNSFSDADNFRGNFMPALMRQVSGLLPGFQLPQSYSAAAMQGGGAPSMMTTGQAGPQSQGQPGGQPQQLAQQGQAQPMPSQFFGQIDWKSLNPHTNGAIPSAAAPPAPEQDEARRLREQEEAYQRYWEEELRGAGAGG